MNGMLEIGDILWLIQGFGEHLRGVTADMVLLQPTFLLAFYHNHIISIGTSDDNVIGLLPAASIACA